MGLQFSAHAASNVLEIRVMLDWIRCDGTCSASHTVQTADEDQANLRSVGGRRHGPELPIF